MKPSASAPVHWSAGKFEQRLLRMRKLEWEMVEPILRGLPRGRFLDVGCGTGFVLSRVQAMGYEVCGLDSAPGDHGVSQDGLAVRIVKGNAESMPFPDSHFDVVFSQHALMYFENRDRGLAEMARVLKEGGTLILVNTTWTMSLIRLVSWWIFVTPRRLARALISGCRWPRDPVFLPPPRVRTCRNSLAEMKEFSLQGFRRLVESRFRILRIVHGHLVPWADWPPLFPPLKLGPVSSSFAAICEKKPAAGG